MTECKIIKQKSFYSKKRTSTKSVFSPTIKLPKNEQKFLIDTLVDPTFVILNANFILKKKLEKFLDKETRENFYMIDRSSKKLIKSINHLRNDMNLDSE